MPTAASAAASGVATGQASATTDTQTSSTSAGLQAHASEPTIDPRDNAPGGRRFPDQAGDAAAVLARPAAAEPGAEPEGRQLALFAGARVSTVPYAALRKLAESAIRKECRTSWNYDWDAFTADDPAWRLTEVVQRRALQDAARQGLDAAPTAVPTDTALYAVRAVIADWTATPERRPSEAGFVEEQARRGQLGRDSQRTDRADRNARIHALKGEGHSNAEIARRVGLNRSQVGRILGKADATPAALEDGAVPSERELPAFPAPEIPRHERWPARQFALQTGVDLDADDARWLCWQGQCYEAEGRIDDLMAAIRAAAGRDVVDPWPYLQRCVANRGDAWTIPAQLLADALRWCGQAGLEYALHAIRGGYVRRPVAYLWRMLQAGYRAGRVQVSSLAERPVAMAVGMARRWAPVLEIRDADAAIAAEAEAGRTGYLDAARRRYGRLPWDEPDPALPPAKANATSAAGGDCCIGLKGSGGDDSQLLNNMNLDSGIVTRDPHKADATQPADPPVPQLAGVADAAGEGGSGGDRVGPEHEPDSPPQPRRCPSPLAALLVARLDLATATLTGCARAGCGCRRYTPEGAARDCPCHLEPSRAVALARALGATGPPVGTPAAPEVAA